MRVIDTQTHWYSPTLWDAYLDLDEYPRCRKQDDGYLYELAPDRWFPIQPHFYELEAQMEAFAAAGIDAVVSSSASFGDVDRLPVEQAKAIAMALNQERADAEREYEGRFYGLGTIPWQDSDAALEVLDQISELGLRGVLLHSNIDGQPVDSEHCRPIYSRIAELGLVLCLHPARTIAESLLRDYGLEYLVGFMFDTSNAALRLVLSGIVAENPSLRIVHPHCGATLPYLAGRIDAGHEKPYSLGEPLPTPPSEQLAGYYTDTVSQSAATLAFARDFYGQGHIVFGSDYPYFSAEEELTFVRGAVEDSEQEAILGANAAALFGLE
jgi:aminocarboxymuconate-semialdehyde decarboxylase